MNIFNSYIDFNQFAKAENSPESKYTTLTIVKKINSPYKKYLFKTFNFTCSLPKQQKIIEETFFRISYIKNEYLHCYNKFSLSSFKSNFNPTFSMRHISSNSLKTVLKNRNFYLKWSIQDIMKCLFAVSEGLLFLHNHLICHGNLCPSNIIIDEAKQSYLVDFGLYPIKKLYMTNDEIFNKEYKDPNTKEELPSRSNDVYSYGILIIEIFLNFFGEQEEDSIEKFKNKEESNKYDIFPKIFKEMIPRCLLLKKEERLTFQGIREMYENESYEIENIHQHVSNIYNKFIKTFYLETLCNQNDSNAMNKLGNMYFKGKLKDDNNERALFYFGVSAAANNSEGQNKYGLLLLKTSNENDIQRKKKGISYLRQSAENGNIHGMCNYGLVLLNGDGIERNVVEAEKFLRKAANFGYVEAQLKYGMSLLQNSRTADRTNQGLEYIRKALNGGSSEAYYSYGMLLKEGEVVEKDEELAAQYLKIGADLGYEKSINEYANCLFNGIGVESNEEESIKYYELSASKGNKEAEEKLKLILTTHLFRESKVSNATKTVEKDALPNTKSAESKSNEPATLSDGVTNNENSQDGQNVNQNKEITASLTTAMQDKEQTTNKTPSSAQIQAKRINQNPTITPQAQINNTDSNIAAQTPSTNQNPAIASQTQNKNSNSTIASQAQINNANSNVAEQTQNKNQNQVIASQTQNKNVNSTVASPTPSKNQNPAIASQTQNKNSNSTIASQTSSKNQNSSIASQAQINNANSNVAEQTQNKNINSTAASPATSKNQNPAIASQTQNKNSRIQFVSATQFQNPNLSQSPAKQRNSTAKTTKGKTVSNFQRPLSGPIPLQPSLPAKSNSLPSSISQQPSNNYSGHQFPMPGSLINPYSNQFNASPSRQNHGQMNRTRAEQLFDETRRLHMMNQDNDLFDHTTPPEVLYTIFLDLRNDYYANRESFKEDKTKFQLFRLENKFLERNDPRIIYKFAKLYRYDEGNEESKMKAVIYLKLSADLGYAKAQTFYGLCLLKGECVKKNEKEGFKYLKKAAKQNDLRGLHLYAISLYNGVGTAKNEAFGLIYMKDAADQGNAESQMYYGLWSKDPIISHEYIEKAANNKSKNKCTKAKFYLAKDFMEGRGVVRNLQRAIEIFSELYEKERDHEALLYLIKCLKETDYGLAIYYMKIFSDLIDEELEKEIKEMQFEYGLELFKGEHTESNIEESFKYIEKSGFMSRIRSEHPEIYSVMPHDFTPIEKGLERFLIRRGFIEWDEQQTIKNARNGDIRATAKAAKEIENTGDYETSNFLYEIAADSNDAESSFILGEYYSEGLHGLPKNESKSQLYKSRAERLGYHEIPDKKATENSNQKEESSELKETKSSTADHEKIENCKNEENNEKEQNSNSQTTDSQISESQEIEQNCMKEINDVNMSVEDLISRGDYYAQTQPELALKYFEEVIRRGDDRGYQKCAEQFTSFDKKLEYYEKAIDKKVSGAFSTWRKRIFKYIQNKNDENTLHDIAAHFLKYDDYSDAARIYRKLNDSERTEYYYDLSKKNIDEIEDSEQQYYFALLAEEREDNSIALSMLHKSLSQGFSKSAKRLQRLEEKLKQREEQKRQEEEIKRQKEEEQRRKEEEQRRKEEEQKEIQEKVISRENMDSIAIEEKQQHYEKEIERQQKQIKELENEIKTIKEEGEKFKKQYRLEQEENQQIIKTQSLKIKEFETQIIKIKALEQKILQIQSNYLSGEIKVAVQQDQTIKGFIYITENGSNLDTTRSKYLLDNNSSTIIGKQSYEGCNQIESLTQEVEFTTSAGTYYLHALLIDDGGHEKELRSQSLKTHGVTSYSFKFTGRVETVTLEAGSYKLEVWGAEGGKVAYHTITSGKGGYSVGTLILNTTTKLFIHVGESPISHLGGWNGGGSGSISKLDSGAGGGGSTDISLYGSEGTSDWNNEDHLYSRIIVAGGGGGSGSDSKREWYGGFGGGYQGQNSGYGPVDNEGTRSRAGMNKSYSAGQGFGVGGSHTGSASSGGGGGWYGGGASNNGGINTGGSGGSGYVFNSSTALFYPSGCKLDSSFFLINSKTEPGDQKIPNPKNQRYEVGHSGHGFARITRQ